jgi:hypothetical protein
MLNWIIDQIPWWVYIVIGGMILLPLMFYFGPVILAVWERMPRWLKITLGVFGGFFMSYLAGRNKAARDAKERERRLGQEAVQTREKVRDEVSKVPDSDLDKRLGKRLRD